MRTSLSALTLVLALLSSQAAKAQLQSFNGCPGFLVSSSRVDDYWDRAIDLSADQALALRDGFYRERYRVRERYWDSGFGWDDFYTNRMRPFAKFYSAMHILGSGVSTSGGWQPYLPVDSFDWFDGVYGTPSLPDIRVAGQKVSLTFRDASGHAVLATYNPYSVDGAVRVNEAIDLHDVATNNLPLIPGRTVFVPSNISDEYDLLIIGLPSSKNQDDNAIVAFGRNTRGDWQGWHLTHDTPEDIRPVVAHLVPSPHGTVRLIVIVADGRLIWMQWEIGAPSSSFGFITLPDWRFVTEDASLVVMPRADKQTSVLGIDRESGHLIHVKLADTFHVSLAEDITEQSESSGFFRTRQLSSSFIGRSPARHVWQSDTELAASRIVASTTNEGIKAYLTRDDFHIQEYTLKGGCVGNVCARRVWTSMDLDQVSFALSADSIFRPPSSASSAIQVNENLFAAPHGLLGIGARSTEHSGNLVHVQQIASAGFWYKPLLQFTDVSSVVTGDDRIEEVRLSPVDLPSANIDPAGTLHVVATNIDGHLVHYYSPSYTRDWNVSDVHDAIFIPNTFRYSRSRYATTPGIVSATSDNGDIHVVGFSRFPNAAPAFEGRLTHMIYRTGRPWHSNFDYHSWADGRDGNFRFESDFDDNPVAYAINRIRDPDRIKMKCPSFSATQGPATIAAFMLHEASHLHYKTRFDVWDHVRIDGTPMDPWLWHGIDDIPLHGLLRNKAHRHSMYQIQVEYLADVAEFGAPWLPLRVRENARFRANTIIRTNIVNPLISGGDGQVVPFRVGVPRP